MFSLYTFKKLDNVDAKGNPLYCNVITQFLKQ